MVAYPSTPIRLSRICPADPAQIGERRRSNRSTTIADGVSMPGMVVVAAFTSSVAAIEFEGAEHRIKCIKRTGIEIAANGLRSGHLTLPIDAPC